MKIVIDISQIIYGTGVSVYVENLVKNLSSIDKENEYVLFGGSLQRFKELKDRVHKYHATPALPKSAGRGSNVKEKIFPIPPTLADLIWNRIHVLPIEYLIGKCDVFHSSDWTQPPTSAYKVTTIHDLAPIRFPKLTHPKIYNVHKARLAWVKKEVDRIIVPSGATKLDTLAYGIGEEKIRVIPEAATLEPVSSEKVESIKRKYKITGEYILSVGVNPRKNSQRVIRAFELATAGQDLKLILVGKPSFIDVEEVRGVRLVGHVSQEELAALYTGAEVLLYPSLYEGFGLPILDAFVCGCPVVTSNISSMPELAGGAAILVDPYSVESIAEGLKMALRRKKSLSEKGLKRAKDFSWQKTAEETLKVYKETKN